MARKDPSLRINILTKKAPSTSNTNWAQGGIAAVLSGTDSFDAHIADTLATGAGLCNNEVVSKIVHDGPRLIAALTDLGVAFSKKDGALALGREGGHSKPRVAHAADLTGAEIERALLAACAELPDQITIFPNHLAADLLVGNDTTDRRAIGALAFSQDENQFRQFHARVTMLATGGLGQVYFHTSNPLIATGDGVAIAWRAGVEVANLEFIQFHPTTLHAPGRWPFLITEAVRGEGGRLKTVAGRLLMQGEHPMGDLAPRDVVARAIDRELKRSGEEYVLLDLSHLDADFIKTRFPNIYKECLRYGFDITQRPIPVVPAAHYSCGGVLSQVDGTTSLSGLYVAGEVAMCGMHGANRLASNSLLEAIAMAEYATASSHAFLQTVSLVSTAESEDSSLTPSDTREQIFIAHERKVLQRIMSDLVGIVRTRERLALAQKKIEGVETDLRQHPGFVPTSYQGIELQNLLTVAKLIVQSALSRTESRGLHYLDDIPTTEPHYERDTILRPS
jgi:L-aspartate oxidase